MSPARKVPAVSTTARARIARPIWVSTPATRPSLDAPGRRRACWNSSSRGSFSTTRAHRGLVQRAVGLAARGAHGRTLAGVERAPLDAGAIGATRHRAAQGVDLAHQVALADPADGRVAAHLADGLDVLGQQQHARAAARRGQRGLGAGVAAADHDDVVRARKVHAGRKLPCCGRRIVREGAGRAARGLARFLQITAGTSPDYVAAKARRVTQG